MARILALSGSLRHGSFNTALARAAKAQAPAGVEVEVATLHGIPRKTARERIDAQLAAIGLQDQAKAVVRSLSGGTRRKVELVRALLHRPRLLLMDEATVGLDPASRQQLLDTVRGLCRDQGMAVLWATHLIEEVKTADRLLLLHQGTVRFDGAISDFMAAAEGPDFQTEVLRALQKA